MPNAGHRAESRSDDDLCDNRQSYRQPLSFPDDEGKEGCSGHGEHVDMGGFWI